MIRLRVFRRRLLEEAAEHPTRDGSVAARALVLFRLVTGRVKRGVRGFGTRMAAVASRSFQSAVGLLRSLSRALGAAAIGRGAELRTGVEVGSLRELTAGHGGSSWDRCQESRDGLPGQTLTLKLRSRS